MELGKKERQQIAGMLTKGRESARVLRRALILRQLDQGQTAAQAAGNVGVAAKTVRAIARRYEGLEAGLYEKPRPGKHGCWTQAPTAWAASPRTDLRKHPGSPSCRAPPAHNSCQGT